MFNFHIDLIFEDWQKNCHSIYKTEKGLELSTGDFHSGSTFPGTITLDNDNFDELFKALKDKYTPVFRISFKKGKYQ